MSEPKSKWVIDVQEANFEAEVVERSKEVPVVVDFWAPWCQPCRMLGPLLEQLVEERGGAVILAKLNTDREPNLAARLGVEALPTVKAFRDGQPVLEFAGLLPEEHLRDFLDRICPTEADRLARQAAPLEATQPAEAEALYRMVLDQERHHEASVVGLARVLLARGQDAEADELLERVRPGLEQGPEVQRLDAMLALRKLAHDLGDEAGLRQRVREKPDEAVPRYQLGCVLAAAENYPEALDMLLSAGERDRALARSQVREAMVLIFHLVGVRSPLADDYRDRLTRILY